jgi:WD40 repeat protein
MAFVCQSIWLSQFFTLMRERDFDMVIHRTLIPAFAVALAGIVTACGGGGGGGGSFSSTPPPTPTVECFADYDQQQARWDAYRSSKGRAVYSGNNGRSVSNVNLASGDIALISDSLPFGTSSLPFSTSGRYIVLPPERISSPVFDQVEGRVRTELSLVGLSAIGVSWAPDDSAVLVNNLVGMQIFSGLPSTDVEYLLAPSFGGTAWSPASDLLATVGDGTIVIYTLSPLRVAQTIPLQPGSPVPRNLSFDPTGQYLAYNTSYVPEGGDGYVRDIYVLNLATLESSIIHSTEDVGGFTPEFAWSPSGKFVALVAYDDDNRFSLRRYSLDSGSTQTIAGAEQRITEFQWAPDTDDLLFLRYDSSPETYSLHLVSDPGSAESTQVSLAGLESIQSIGWSPDSRYFTYVAWDQSDDNRLYAGDARESCFSEVELLSSDTSGPYPGATWSPSGQYLLYRAGDGQDVEYVVARPDGSGRMSLSPLVLPEGSAERIEGVQWTRVSDTVYFKKWDTSGGRAKSINFVEIDSLSQISVDANGVFGFADYVYFTY